MENGQGTLEDNEIFDGVLYGIIMSGSNPTLRRNRIFMNGRFGFLSSIYSGGGIYMRNSQATLEDNEIFANEGPGVEIMPGVITTGGNLIIRTDSNPILRRNRITQNSSVGIAVILDGGGIFEDNDLRGNTGGAWYIAPESTARVQRSGNIE
ncbi:MAG: parallel beta-helix repeat (two copies) [Candidatus Electronema aureum]|uniref:Parallel beta-helix repeat (Two copies) n=1 Tax=Candidatus Electronema aureum TaxID=2005002 RepID=A0A521G2S3_9BACT|nr:MAG: parallel beta-helix repeat (two copies) [Candidatus Electronema aureum]